MPALAGEKWPRSASAPALERAAVVALPITIVAITLPARPDGKIDLENCVHDCYGILHHWIVRPIAYEFKKSGIDNFSRWEICPRPGFPIMYRHRSLIRTFIV